jgi:glycosyltransferase involved in cell wall biosynthesis
MKILTLTQKFSGCGYHRLMLPVSFMEKDYGRITDNMTEEQWQEKKYDIVYINRVWDNEDLIERRKEHGFKLVVDVDDYWHLNHDHLMYEGYNASNFAARLIHHMREADLVTCTHERLADAIYPHNKNIVIVPNAIPYGESQFDGERVKTEGVKLFWAGGITHEPDLKLLQGVMYELDQHVKDVHMVMGGYSDSNETERYYWGRMASYFTNDRKLQYTIIRGMDVFEYYKMFRHADVMLIPLVKNNFNAYKSNIKILEAAGKAVPVVCSNVHPYIGLPTDVVNYAKDRKEWLRYIKRLVNDEYLRNEQGAQLHEYCQKNYNFNAINEKRRNAFLSLLSL